MKTKNWFIIFIILISSCVNTKIRHTHYPKRIFDFSQNNVKILRQKVYTSINDGSRLKVVKIKQNFNIEVIDCKGDSYNRGVFGFDVELVVPPHSTISVVIACSHEENSYVLSYNTKLKRLE